MRPYPKNLSTEEIRKLREEVQSTKPYKICGNVSTNKDGIILVCKEKAGFATQHIGEGPCKFHGGSGRRITHGKGMVYKPQLVKTLLDKAKELHMEAVEDHMESVKIANVLIREVSDLLDLEDNYCRDRNLVKENLTPVDRAGLARAKLEAIELVRRLLDTKIKAEEAQLRQQEKDVITAQDLLMLMSQVLEVIDGEVKDVYTKQRIFAKIKDVYIIERGPTIDAEAKKQN